MTPSRTPSLLDSFPGTPEILLDRVGFLLNRATQKIREIVEGALAPFGLTGKHLGVLMVLQEKGALPQQGIGKCLHVDRTTMVQIIDDLEKAGLVERRENPEDRRAYSMVATAKGRTILPKAMQLALKAEREFLGGLTAQDQKELLRLLKGLVLHHYPAKD